MAEQNIPAGAVTELPPGSEIILPGAAEKTTPESNGPLAGAPEGFVERRPTPPTGAPGDPGFQDIPVGQFLDTRVPEKSFGESFVEAGQRTLESLGTPEFAEAAGGMAGGIIGGATGAVRGGPAAGATGLRGSLVGGAAGAAVGRVIFDTASNFVDTIEGSPDELISFGAQVSNMGEAAFRDLVFGAGGASLLQVPRLVRAGRAKIMGLASDSAVALAEAADRLKIGLGAVDISEGVLARGFARVMGVFPFLGTPLRKGQVSKVTQAKAAVAKTLDAFGPNDKLAGDIGIDMVEAARGVHAKFKTTAAALYTRFEDAVNAASRQDIIPTDKLREFADEVAERVSQGRIEIVVGNKEIATGVLDAKGNVVFRTESVTKTLPRGEFQEVIDFLQRLRSLPETITPTQHRRLMEDFNDLINKRLKDGFDIKQLAEAKVAARQGLDNPRLDLVPPGEAEAITDSLTTANTFYSKGIVQFQTRAAQVLERVDKFIFRAGAADPGTLNADELVRTAINLRSPQQVRNLTTLVGKENMRRAAAVHFEEAVKDASVVLELQGRQVDVIDPVKLERALGLTGAGRKKIEGLREFYKTAGIDLDDVQGLIKVMRSIEGIGNPAEFVRRRAVLGGITAIGGAFAVGVASDAPIITGAAIFLLSRHFSKVIARPDRLKLMTTALNEAGEIGARRAALGRLLKILVPLDDNEGDLPIGP